MPWYFYLALKQLFPSGKRVSFFSLMAILGVTLGVMVLIIVQSVMNGFGNEIRSKLIQTHGDFRLESGSIIDDYDELLETALAHPAVQTAAPFAQGIIMLQYNGHPAFPGIYGLDLDPSRQVIPMRDFMVTGSLEALNDESILVSSQLAASLGVTNGSILEVYTPLMIERMKADEVLLPRELEVVGIFETGWNQVDSNLVVIPLRLMQELYGMDEGVHGVAVRLKESGRNVEKVAAEFNHQLRPRFDAITWMERDQDLLFVLQLEKTTMFFIIIFIIIVASFSIASSLMTSVVRKTREIGLLGAMGASPKHCAAVFCLQGFIIGTSGTFLGIAGGLTALYFRNNIVHTLASITNSQEALLTYYQFANIPVHYLMSDFLLITSFSILIATLAGFIPAWRASHLKPAEALRSE